MSERHLQRIDVLSKVIDGRMMREQARHETEITEIIRSMHETQDLPA